MNNQAFLDYEFAERQKAFHDWKRAAYAAINAPTFTSNEKALEWISAMGTAPTMTPDQFKKLISDPQSFMDDNGKFKEMVGKREQALYFAYKSLEVVSDVTFGRESMNPILTRKAIGGLFTQPGNYPIAASFASYQAPQDLDMNWMFAFNSVDLRGALIGKLVDWVGEAKFYELINNESIKYSNIGYDKATDVVKRIFAGGHSIDMDMVGNAPALTLNNAFTSLRLAAEAKKSDIAYSAINDEYDGTENYATSVVNTFNVAGHTLKNKFVSTKLGINVTPSTLLLMYANPSNQATVEQALNAIRGTDGTSAIVIHNIRPIFSYKIDATTATKKAVKLLVPGQKAVHATFQDLTTNQETHFDTQRVKVAAVEKYNIKFYEEKQNLTVNLEA